MNHKQLPKIILFLFGLVLYINTSSFQFALDDKIVISYNEFTKKGIDGISDIFENEAFTGFFGKKKNLVEGGRYRPLTLAYFAVVWDVLGPSETANPKKFKSKSETVASFLHISNAAFYGLTGVLLYLCLLLLIPFDEKKKWYEGLAFIIAMLFLAHPIHTEVVANIKSLDEIWALLGGLASFYFATKYITDPKIKYLFLSFLVFGIGAFAKESIVVFIGVIPLTLWFFKTKEIKKIALALLPSVVAFVFYFICRTLVLGDVSTQGQEQLLNQPFLYAEGSEKTATILLCMLLYLKLSFVPHPLTHDYYPWHPVADGDYIWNTSHYPYADLSNPLVICSMLIYIILLSYGLRYLFTEKGDKVLAYCSLFFIGTFILFTNLFFEIGVFMNERFMYVPSLAVVVVVIYLLGKFLPKNLHLPALILLFALGSFKTISRNSAWENDQTLAITDHVASSGSAKVNMSAGGAYYELARVEKNMNEKTRMLNKSIKLLEKSLRLYPNYIQSKTLLGHSLYEAGQYDKSIKAYESGLAQNPNFNDIERAVLIISDTLTKAKKAPIALKYLEMLAEKKPGSASIYDRLGQIYGKELGQLDKSIPLLLKAHQLDSTVMHTIENLGVAYGMTGDFKTSLTYFLKALKLKPKKKNLLENIGKTYYYMGDQSNANKYLEMAKAL